MADVDQSKLSALEKLTASNRLDWPDYVIIAVYFLIIIGVGIWSSCRNRGSTKGYFLAGRSMHLIPVGASLFASNIGSGHFIGLAGSGASSGIGVSVFEFTATYILLLLGWVFVPVYIASGVMTMPEYLKKRFGGERIRVYLAFLSLILYIFTKISADLYSGSIFLEQAVGLNKWISNIFLLLLAMLFTVAGGLTAVIWTDFAQTAIMIVGATWLMIRSLMEVGKDGSVDSFGSLFEVINQKYFAANDIGVLTSNSTCAQPPSFAMHIMRPYDLTDDLPWTGVLTGLMVSSVWYWCADQVIVQRALAAKNMSHARAGTILAGYLKFLPLWLLVIPGMISRILYPDLVGCSTVASCQAACKLDNGCTNIAYPLLVIQLMPVVARGLMIAVMMSALMSSLTSIFNSGSTIFTMDIWTRFRKNASEAELLIVGRVFVVILMGVSVAWTAVVENAPRLFDYIQEVTSFLAPPVCAVYVLAVLWKRVNEQGAFWGLAVGLASGLIRFVLQYFAWGSAPPCEKGVGSHLPDIIGKVHFLHFGMLLFVQTIIIVIVVSLLTKPIDNRRLIRLTYLDRDEPGERLEYGDEIVPEHLEDIRKEKKDDDLDGLAIDEPDERPPWYKIAFNWICGIEKHEEPDQTDEEKAEAERKSLSIEETPRARLLNNVNASILIILTTFIWGYFA